MTLPVAKPVPGRAVLWRAWDSHVCGGMRRPRELYCPIRLRGWIESGQPLDAACLVREFVRLRLGDWRAVFRDGGQWRFGVDGTPYGREFESDVVGRPEEAVYTVVDALLRQLTRPVGRRLAADAECRRHVMALAVQALVDGDLESHLGLLRLLIGRRRDHVLMAGVLGVHPKSLVRMLGRGGNPSARTLALLLRQMADVRGELLVVVPSARRRRVAPRGLYAE